MTFDESERPQRQHNDQPANNPHVDVGVGIVMMLRAVVVIVRRPKKTHFSLSWHAKNAIAPNDSTSIK